MTQNKTLTTRILVGNYLFSAPYSHSGVQRLIQWIMDSQGIGQFELSKRSGLSPATIFQILNKTEREVTRPPRKSTLSSLASAVGAEVQIDSKKNIFFLVQKYEMPKLRAKELSLLLSDIGNIVMDSRRTITREERERIVRVVKALI